MDPKFIVAEKTLSNSGLYLFEKDITVPKDQKATVKIFASARYILYINGKYVCEGPCRGYHGVNYYDTAEVTLENGVNRICVKVLNVNDICAFTTVFKTTLPLCVFEAVTENQTFVSDSSWSCRYVDGHFFNRQGFYPLAPYEEVICGSKPVRVGVKELDNSFEFVKEGYFRIGGIADPIFIKERPIPMIYPEKEIPIHIVKRGENYIDFGAEEYATAKLKFKIAKNSSVKITYSECYEFSDGKGLRDDTSGTLKGYFDTVKTADEEFVFEPFWFRTFRFIRIEGDFEAVTDIAAQSVHYPFEVVADFNCSDETYNKIFDVSRHTLNCCAHEIVVDCPYYEQQQYIMDASVEFAVVSKMTKDRRLTKKALLEFAMSQQETGLLMANYPSQYIQIIPGFSLFLILMLRDYLEESGDIAFATNLIGTVDRILSYFGEMAAKKGYITKSRYWDFVDWVPRWENGTPNVGENEALTVYNLYYAATLRAAAEICRRLKRNGLAAEYDERYKCLADTVNRLCFNEEKGLYRDGSKSESYSAHGIVWAILSEVAPKERWDTLIAHLFDKDVAKCSFSMNFYLFRALEKCNKYHLAFPVFNQWKQMLDNHCTTWCENPDSPRSECHAWSCAPYYEFLTNVLGVKVGFENEITIKPTPNTLTFARGTASTRFGEVSVEWNKTGSKFSLKLKGAEGVRKKIILPSGKVYETQSDTFFIEETE